MRNLRLKFKELHNDVCTFYDVGFFLMVQLEQAEEDLNMDLTIRTFFRDLEEYYESQKPSRKSRIR